MRQSQSKDLKSLFGTLVAHGSPRARSGLGRSTLQSTSKLDTSLSTAGTALQLAKDAGDAASKVPYVKAVAGILSQIIRIRDVSAIFHLYSHIYSSLYRKFEPITSGVRRLLTLSSWNRQQFFNLWIRSMKLKELRDLRTWGLTWKLTQS